MTPLKQLAEHGQSVWIDYLSRKLVHDGDLAGLVRDGVVGVTSNPTTTRSASCRPPSPTRRRSSWRWRATTSATPATS